MRRAWGASRVVDYLLTRKEVNRDQIAITGHSRNGKQSLWAAAFDERISAVVSSSCGTGGIAPWRYGDPQYDSETLDIVAGFNPQWFHPRFRFFFGHEDRLTIDQSLLL
jgi:BAAT / Acyl-CoA thioester hydrolase C terminal